MKQFIKSFNIGLLILLLTFHLLIPSFIYAQEVTPTDTPTPTVEQTTIDNSATVNNATDSTANTGDNTVNPTPDLTITPDLTPTTDPFPSVTPTEDPSTPDESASDSGTINASNSADIDNTVSTTSSTGSNSVTSNNTDSSPENQNNNQTTKPITIQTGDAVSIVAGSNTINTTGINSDMTNQTINIFGDQSGNIDLSTLFQLVNTIITQSNNTDPVINIQVTGINNYAYLTNTTISNANTGGNTVNGTNQNVVVTTGNADSVVSIINKINLTVVNSSLHLVTINIFGHLTGNIILPNLTPYQSTTCASCGVSFNTQNQAVVTNTVSSNANTGQNTLAATSGAALTTGNAQSSTNTINIVNQTVLGMIFENLFINTFGTWNGSFLGWDSFGPATSGTLTFSSSVPTTSTTPTLNHSFVTNTAYVTNTISSLANTGGNTTTGENTFVSTGNAYSAVSLTNLINSTFFRTLGFFGFINIFGNFDGNIGGADKFTTQTSSQDQSTANLSSAHRESGGGLSITNSNNVGAYVLPGDTVTFFLDTKNIGTGKVYGANVSLYLTRHGENVGGATYSLGDIRSGGEVKITTGLVLAKDATPGEYIAHAEVRGTTGDNNEQVSAISESTFSIFGFWNGNIASAANNNQKALPQKDILGTTIKSDAAKENNYVGFLILMSVILAYIAVAALKKRLAKEEALYH